MATCSEAPTLVTFRGGFAADWAVVNRLLQLEARGCRFTLIGRYQFRVQPFDLLTADEVVFLRQHRDECRRVLEHDADACAAAH